MKFFDRKSVLDLLNKRVVDLMEGYRKNLALIGPEFIGKTSILEAFLAQLNDERIIPVYLPLSEIDFNDFVEKFIGKILYNFLLKRRISTTESNLDILWERSRTFIPLTCELIKKIRQDLVKNRWSEVYRNVLNLPESLEQESGGFCLVIFDEFQRLEEFGISNVFQELGKKIMVQKQSLYIVTSSSRAKAKKILTERLSLLFGNFEVVEIAPFSIKTSLEFIDQFLGEYALEKSYKNFLVDFTAGYPFYLDTICEELIITASKEGQRNIFLNVLIDGLERILFNKWGTLNLHFTKIISALQTKKGGELYLSILSSVAEGRNKLPLILEDHQSRKKAVPTKVNQLIEAGILIKSGNLICFFDKLFGFWLKDVYQRRLKSFSDNPSQIGEDFKNDLRQRINYFVQISGKELDERISDLLQSFGNELFQLNGKKHRLPSFTSVSPLSFNGAATPNLKGIVAESGGEFWAITFKEGMILDSDVTAFLDSTKELKKRISRKVIIAINEIDPNARLRALQEKMWVWSARDLNSILNLYGKSLIVK